MADIPIQRKEGNNIWPWIIGLIVILAIAWFLFARNRNTVPAGAAMTDSTGVMTTPYVAPAPGTVAPGTTTPGTTTPVTPGTPGTPAAGTPVPRTTP